MASAEQLRALLQSHVDGDNERFYAVAMQVAAHAARQGHGKLALELRALVDEAKVRAGSRSGNRRPVPVVQPKGELAGLLAVSYPSARLVDLVLDPDTRDRLDRILLEQRQRDKLAAHGLLPRRKLLLVGPPGTGKTFTARALAGEMHLPLFAVLLDGLITKYMGETAAKLRLVFDAADETRGVYLFDEFDALGGERANANDVGEARRTLNAFLQFVEQDESQSLLVAATNHVGLLDRALFRRFDDIVTFALPNEERALEVMKTRLATMDTTGVDWLSVGQAMAGLSQADIARASDDAAKEAVLGDMDRIRTSSLLAALDHRHNHA